MKCSRLVALDFPVLGRTAKKIVVELYGLIGSGAIYEQFERACYINACTRG